MKIWASINENNRLVGYSFSEMNNFIELVVEKEPVDVFNWIVQDGVLIYNPEGYNPEENLSELEKLRRENDQIRKKQKMLESAILEISDFIFK